MSTEWIGEELGAEDPITVIPAAGFPPTRHPAEADVFARHEGVPGHVQAALEDARVVIVGAGGLGSWVALGLARSGVRALTLIDHDRFERSNASRQLAFAGDVGRFKSQAVATNIAPHLIAGGMITAIGLPFEAAAEQCALAVDLLIVMVDNNACRWEAARLARKWRVPAVFSMLSGDSMRMQTFLQGPDARDACLWCALPNLDPETAAPCASAVIASCFASCAHSLFFAYRALMGWPEGATVFNWRSMDLFGLQPEEIGYVRRRPECALCGESSSNL